MKNLKLKTAGLLGAAALLMLAAAPTTAGQWDGDPELESSAFPDDVERPAYVGTALSEPRERTYIYSGRESAFPNHDIDQTGFVSGMADPEKGDGELYGSILFDVGTWR